MHRPSMLAVALYAVLTDLTERCLATVRDEAGRGELASDRYIAEGIIGLVDFAARSGPPIRRPPQDFAAAVDGAVHGVLGAVTGEIRRAVG